MCKGRRGPRQAGREGPREAPERPTLILVPLRPFRFLQCAAQTKAELEESGGKTTEVEQNSNAISQRKRSINSRPVARAPRGDVRHCQVVFSWLSSHSPVSPSLLGANPPKSLLSLSLSLSLSPFLPPHFSRINLFRCGKVAVTTTPSRARVGEARKREEKAKNVIYSPLKEPPSELARASGTSILLLPNPRSAAMC